MINNVVLVSGVQQSDLVVHTRRSILFQILVPFRFLHNVEQSSMDIRLLMTHSLCPM